MPRKLSRKITSLGLSYANRMGRSARTTKQSRQRDLAWHYSNLIGLTDEEMERTLERMELYDSLPAECRALVREYGLRLGMELFVLRNRNTR